jgi:transcriptional regulator with XRE-family HTH domain
MGAAQLIRDSRRAAGLTQTQLARRLCTTQPAIARLESPDSNPTIRSVEDALNATGRRLTLTSEPVQPSVDESLIRKQLTLTPAERLNRLESMYREARKLTLAGRRARGELA